MQPIPILIYGDSPSLHTGLARISRHLAVLLSGMPEFRVGTYGRGGIVSRHLPWPQYTYPEGEEWGHGRLQGVWEDFSGKQFGIIFTIMDASRVHWLSRPQYLPDGDLKKWLTNPGFQRWGYFPVDHVSIGGALDFPSADAIRGYNRVLAYTLFGSEVLTKITGREASWLPHGLDLSVFRPRGRDGAKWAMGFSSKDVLIGTVGTNQYRKHWGQAAQIIKSLRNKDYPVHWWIQVDELTRYWDLQSLIHEMDLTDVTIVRTDSLDKDDTLSYHYSACDVTILPTGGEGFGYPIVESLACGTPCITVNYAGGAELVMSPEHLVQPVEMVVEAAGNSLRPVTKVGDWIEAIERVLHDRPSAEECRRSVEYLGWENLSQVWKRWMLEGIDAGNDNPDMGS